MPTLNFPLETNTRTKIDTRLTNLGWELNESNPKCNVFKGHPRTKEEQKKLEGYYPDYVLYDEALIKPIAVIEAKRPGESIEQAMKQAIDRYATRLDVPLVFTCNDTFVQSLFVPNKKPLKIDGEELQDFIDQYTALRFLNEGTEILSAPKEISVTREDLLRKFKRVNNLLRKEGFRNGYERFSAFADVLFLKLFDESEKLREHQGKKRILSSKYSWTYFTNPKNFNDVQMLDYVKDSVWKRLKNTYGDLFEYNLEIKKPEIFKALIEMLDFNLTSTDVDVKGDAFEFFLKNVTNGNKDLGEYFTPRHVIRTMVNLVKPKFGEKIYDPFCGTGGFLVEVFKYMRLRISDSSEENLRILKEETIFGRDLTSTARTAQMNLIMFDDGFSNIKRMDSLENPVEGEYNVVLTNIPYSQTTEFGNYYDVKTNDADSVCVQHAYKSLKPDGRAAIIVPETFLYDDGKIGETRKLILKNSKNVSIISLPRGVFYPYTPTKTNIFYFEKGGNFKKVFFFVVKNDGFELNTNRKKLPGPSDFSKLLSMVDDPQNSYPASAIVGRETIEDSGRFNLRPFYYMEDKIETDKHLVYLKGNIVERKEFIDPRTEPDKEWEICGVSKQGVFLGEVKFGRELNQEYKTVRTGELVFNPYRINIGSIGIVPSFLDGCLVSPAYVVFTSTSKIPNEYIFTVLKHKRFQEIIMSYSLGSARADFPFSGLERIAIPEPTETEIKMVENFGLKFRKAQQITHEAQKSITDYSYSLIKDKGEPMLTKHKFKEIIKLASQPLKSSGKKAGLKISGANICKKTRLRKTVNT